MSLTRALRRAYVRSGIQRLLPHRANVAMRRAWLRIAWRIGYPISSPLVPRPPLSRRRAPMRLSRVLMACDLNRDYLDFWPSTRQAWREIVGVEPLLVLVADEVPLELADDPAVVQFAPVPGLHTAFQAQCIRLLYPALVPADGAVLISDIDLYPLRPSYFHAPIARLDERFFVSYRDTRLERAEVNMMFNAAAPRTWADLFAVSSLADVRRRLAEWGTGLAYDGRRAWDGWYTDQQTLYRTLMSWPKAPERLWMLDDDYTGYRRLDHLDLAHEAGLEPHRRRDLLKLAYSDYACLVPYQAHREVNDLVLELALQAAARRS
jgi:hypothetical protein